jgi:hypothetical protein
MSTNMVAPSVPATRASDDEILGITTNGPRRSGRNVADRKSGHANSATVSQVKPDDLFSDRARGEDEVGDSGSESDDEAADNSPNHSIDLNGEGEHRKLNELLAANPELRNAMDDAKAYREIFATPAEAQTATKLLGDLNRMDALFFSQRPEDHVELARAVAELDPQAFASLARAMSTLTTSVPEKTNAQGATSFNRPKTGNDNANPARTTQPGDPPAANANSATSSVSGLTAAQSDFFHSTNAAAVQGVMEAIETQVDRLLPEGISKQARNRVAGEIYRELDTTLQGNRALGQQMRDAFRSGALDEAHRRAIVSLVTGRARQALPGVAKRVLNEWTNTIVSANQDRRARQRNAERRVDISGSSGGNDGRRAISSRDIDYGRMSDGDILNL